MIKLNLLMVKLLLRISFCILLLFLVGCNRENVKLIWHLNTDDTHMTITIINNHPVICELINPGNGWNWTPNPSDVPLLNRVSIGGLAVTPEWIFRDVSLDSVDGSEVTLRFTSSKPKLELKSYWRARKGCGPVENWMTVENKTGGDITYNCADIISSNLTTTADSTIALWRFDRCEVGLAGYGVNKNSTWPNTMIVSMVNSGFDQPSFVRSDAMLPFLMMDVVSTHGLYIGYGWDSGMFITIADSSMRTITNRFNLANANPVEFAEENGKILIIPYTFYGTYMGDTDDGSNNMKKWFWNYRMTRTMRENNDEPLVEIHAPFYDEEGWVTYLKNHPLKSWGVDLIKMDIAWTNPGPFSNWGNETSYTKSWNPWPAKWPNGMSFGSIAHAHNLKSSLYMNGTYRDVDLATQAGRDAEKQALLERFDNVWYDYWRSDFHSEAPNDYLSHEGLLEVIDFMITNRPGFRWENCSGGGAKKSFDLAERMTFITTDDFGTPHSFRWAFYGNSYVFNPVQLKADLYYGLSFHPDSQGLDNSILYDKYIFRTGLLGAMMVSSEPKELDEQKEGVARETWNLYQTRQRAILRGADVYHILPFPDGVNLDGIQFFNKEINKGSVLLFKPSDKSPDSKIIKLKGLDRNAIYMLTFQDRKEQNTKKSGAELMDKGIEVIGMSGNFDSEIIWIN
jgi:hypothetical protein